MYNKCYRPVQGCPSFVCRDDKRLSVNRKVTDWNESLIKCFLFVFDKRLFYGDCKQARSGRNKKGVSV